MKFRLSSEHIAGILDHLAKADKTLIQCFPVLYAPTLKFQWNDVKEQWELLNEILPVDEQA